ncbi:MAG: 7-cyano-7-deazaguanine synthase QueC [Tannerellaceae bacterium]
MNQLNHEAAIVCFSGGQDSTTCLFWALKNFKEVHTICFDYGQRHAQEIEVAKEIANKAGVSFQILDMSLLNGLTSNALTNTALEMDKEAPEGGVPNTFVPGRNLLFLSFVAVVAHQMKIANIVTGVSQTDFSGYPDCRDTFVRSLNVTLNLAINAQFIIHTPLMWKDKAEVWQLSDELGVLDLVRNETLTCYNGVMADGCGECPSCKLRNEGLHKYLASKQNINQTI